MQSPPASDTSQKLIRCSVKSNSNSVSLRYVELEHYKLWSYMMLHKHGIKITDASLWLWMKEEEVEAKKEQYAHFPTIEKVNKIELFIFDERYGFTHTIHRFTPAHESNLLEQRLLSHISPQIINSDNYSMRTQRGYCIQCGKSIKNMILGLSGTDDRIWYRKR